MGREVLRQERRQQRSARPQTMRLRSLIIQPDGPIYPSDGVGPTVTMEDVSHNYQQSLLAEQLPIPPGEPATNEINLDPLMPGCAIFGEFYCILSKL